MEDILFAIMLPVVFVLGFLAVTRISRYIDKYTHPYQQIHPSEPHDHKPDRPDRPGNKWQ